MSSEPISKRSVTQLDRFDNSWYKPGRSLPIRLLWLGCNGIALLSWVPWPMSVKRGLLRLFGARVGRGVVIKPRVNIKYPWNVSIGDHAWIGEGVWLDSLAKIEIGANACLSQGCTIETGNHDWSKPSFDLILKQVIVEDGAWAAVKSLLLPGSRLASHAVLGAGSVLAGDTEAYAVYVGVPAKKVRQREISDAP